jgi:N utilization substance protein A
LDKTETVTEKTAEEAESDNQAEDDAEELEKLD